MSNTLTRVQKLIREQLGIREEQIALDTHFVNDLDAESLDMIELCMALEESFDFEIPDEEFERISTVRELVEYVNKRLGIEEDLTIVAMVETVSQPNTAQNLAVKFHDTYEALAPQFGYETRLETRQFDPESANGKLMIAVCKKLIGDGTISVN